MTSKNGSYTYRCGQKVKLEKKPHQFVIRQLPENLLETGWSEMEQVSSASTRITVSEAQLESSMTAGRGMAPTHHAYHLQETGDAFLITDRIFVRFKKEPKKNTLNEFLANYSLLLKAQYSPKDFLVQLTDYTGINPVKLVVKLTEEEALVKNAGHDLNRIIQKYQTLVPTDTSYLNQWHLHTRRNHRELDDRSSSHCETAWDVLGNYGNSEVVIGVTDDGCRLDHDDFNSANKFAAWGYFRGERLISNADIEADGNRMYERGSNHGTSCAGVIAGEVDAVKTVGAAPDCRLAPIKWESDGPSLFISDSKLITALNFLDDKVDIISNSWGSSPTSIWEDEVIDKIRTLSSTGGRRGKGIVFLWAAGNDNCPIEHNSTLNIPYTMGWSQRFDGSWQWVGVRTSKSFRHNLVDLPGVMHIAALASDAKRSHYSNYGTGISLCAASSNSHTYHRMEVDGLGIETATGNGSGVTRTFGGTSSATPLVAGVAALVISANAELTAAEVISILKQTASKDLRFGGYPRTPAATYNSNTSWDISPVTPFDNGSFQDLGLADGSWSPWFGHGNVDAAAAVRAAIASREDQDTVVFKKSSAPELAIPDWDGPAVTDVINCPDEGILQTIKVGVDITHTYIGDLVIKIISPSGREARIHNRNGASTDNIKKTFDVTNAPELALLQGDLVKGDWKLTVQDKAHLDTGILNSWNLELGVPTIKEVSVEENPGTGIPDNAVGGIERTLNVSKSGRIKGIEVSIDITHTYIGDLKVELISPRNNSFLLHNRIGGSQDNIIKTYAIENTAVLSDLRGKSIRGAWKLRVVDHAAWDTGKLNFWKLRFLLE